MSKQHLLLYNSQIQEQITKTGKEILLHMSCELGLLNTERENHEIGPNCTNDECGWSGTLNDLKNCEYEYDYNEVTGREYKHYSCPNCDEPLLIE